MSSIRHRTGSSLLAIAVALIAQASAAEARGMHHFGMHHGMHTMIGGMGEGRVGEGRLSAGGHVDEAYAKAVSAEHERLLGKLKDICRGC